MPITNPLAYYSGVGRGAGTILKTPDLEGVIANAEKLQELRARRQEQDNLKKLKLFDDITKIAPDYWAKDTGEIEKDMQNFQQEVLKRLQRTNGTLTGTDMIELNAMKSNIQGKMKKSKDAQTRYYKVFDEINNNPKKYDVDGVAKVREELIRFAESSINDRGALVINLPEAFDLKKYLNDNFSKMSKYADRASKTMLDADGKFITTDAAKYISLTGVQHDLEFTMNTNTQVEDAMKDSYLKWSSDREKQGLGRNITIDYFDYNGSGLPKPVTKNVDVDSVDDYAKYVVAPLYTMNQDYSKMTHVGGEMNISVGTGADKDGGNKGTEMPSTFNAQTRSGENTSYPAYTVVNAKPDFINAAGGVNYTPSSSTIFISGDSSLLGGGSVKPTSANAELIPVLTKDVNIGGKTYRKGTFVTDIPLPNNQSVSSYQFINDPKNKGSWKWKSAIRFTITKGKSSADVYELTERQPSYTNWFKPVNGMTYFQFLKQEENSKNDAWGITGTGGGTNTNTTKKPNKYGI